MTLESIAAVEVRKLLPDVSRALFALSRPAVDAIIESIDAARQGVVLALMNAAGREPDTITAADITRRYPYATTAVQDQPLAAAAQLGYLTVRDGAYRLTEAGQDVLSRLTSAFQQRLGELEPALAAAISIDDLAYTADDLMRLAEACRTSDIDTWGTQMSHALAVQKPVVALAHIDQAIDDLTAFRDDAHLAAWRPYNISGHTWELFTFLWRGEVKNAAEFAIKAQHRGHTPDAYAAALAELVDRGWVQAASDETYTLTVTGREVRDMAEAETDRLYYAPWAVLDDAQLTRLAERLTRLKAGLVQLAEPVPV